jgi:flagellar basal body P-ring protein FlgI
MREPAVRHKHVTRSLSSLVGIMLAASSGCFQEHENKAKIEVGVTHTESPFAKSAAYRDTIGALTYYDGMGPMRVRGYGLVVGLGKNGSSDCPRPIYDRLVQSLYKHHRFSSSVVGERNISPEQLIADPDTAVVLVQGEIPPAAVEETRFDVGVMALPGTQTKSLRGGRLFTADLEVFREVGPSASISGQVLAMAAGPVFLNPFAEGDAATKSNPLEGIVVGGGFVVKDRRVRLVLTQPSYPKARQIQDRINSQFSGPTKVADALSPSFIQLHVPQEYRDDTGHFLALVRSLYLTRDPSFEASRATTLAEEIIHPAAPHAQISQCFEGLGRAALPKLNELYAHNKDYVSFHAAVAGMRLGDHVACDCLAMHAAKVDGEFRYQAIRALAEAKGMGAAAVALRKLLHDSDTRVQIAAYEALVKRDDPTIESIPIAGDNFVLDHIPDASTNFIYVKRTVSRRIAMFGDKLQCSPPVLYRAPDGSVTINAGAGDEELTVLRSVVASGSMSPPIPAPRALPPLIRLLGNEAGIASGGAATGLGLDYGAVVRALYYLCQNHAINAKFILEQPTAAELFGPAQLAGRPESEL